MASSFGPVPAMSSAFDAEDDTFDTENNSSSNNNNHNNNGASLSPSAPLFDLSILREEDAAAAAAAAATNTTTIRARAIARFSSGDDSAATTADIASSLGSVVMGREEAFLKSFTFYPTITINSIRDSDDNDGNNSDDDINNVDSLDWGIEFGTAVDGRGNGSLSSKFKPRILGSGRMKLPVAYVDEDSIFGMSRIRPGDYLKSINGRTVGPSLCQPDLALQRMKDALRLDGYLCVTTKNRDEDVNDVLVHATIVKPSAKMSLKDLGINVWIWGVLCIKEIRKDSIFSHTALRERDHIMSVNEIDCQNVSPEQFKNICQQLPQEITVTVLRRKQRNNGNFK